MVKTRFGALISFWFVCSALFLSCDTGTGPVAEIRPLEVRTPKGGESYNVGQSVSVDWKINDVSMTSVGVKLSLDNGKSYTMLADHSFPPETTSIVWSVTNDQVSGQCILKVYKYNDESVYAKSGTFSVVK